MSIKVAFVCDWLTGMRGGEKCLKAMCDVFPDADIFTLVHFPENFNGEFADHRIVTSFIQKLPGNDRTFRRYLPLFPRAVESFDLSGYELVVSFSHCVAKGVRVSAATPHICYCHTPVRYAWDMRWQYLESLSSLKRILAGISLNRLKQWDVKSSVRVGTYIANSRHVQNRIRRCYRRDSNVIYPPVDVDRFEISLKSEGYYLVFSAFVPYKQIDLAVQAFNGSARRLIVAGSGPEYHRLRSMAKSNIEFILNPDDRTVERLYAGCRALVFPGEEDFGIIPLEAQACGKPVIALAKGGALETVIGFDPESEDLPTGVFFDQQNQAALQQALNQFEVRQDVFRPDVCRRNAERFNVSRYQRQMCEFVHAVTGIALDQ